MLVFNKSFRRRIIVGIVPYVVEQNGNTQTLSIKNNSTKKYIYFYDAKNNTSEFATEDLEIIKHVFEQAHVERYVLSSPH